MYLTDEKLICYYTFTTANRIGNSGLWTFVTLQYLLFLNAAKNEILLKTNYFFVDFLWKFRKPMDHNINKYADSV